ncbi:hypothetical protein EJB05_44474, partial [Eragrostis curvula]
MEPPGGGGSKKPKGAAAAPAVEMAGDDVLGEILLRLPDTASLARAALACKLWRRVASDPALLRRFHSLHEPPLLGFLMMGPPPRPEPVGYKGPDHRFLPASSRNPHIAAAAKAAIYYHFEDFAARNPRSGALIDRWVLRGCDGGRLLLSYGDFHREELAVYDPIARTAEFLPRPDDHDIQFEFMTFMFRVHHALVTSQADASFRVFVAQFMCGRIYGAVFSSRTGEWAMLPSLRASDPWNMRAGMRAGRFVYWKSNTCLKRYFDPNPIEQAAVLDTTTMEWRLIEAPFPSKESYCVADIAEHGGLCLVASKEQCLQLWVCGNDGWVIKKKVFLLKEFASLKLLRRDEWMKRVRVLEVRDGYVYMELWSIRKPNSYLLVLNWQTMKLRVLANDTDEKYRGPAFPFFMTWAPPMLSPAECNKVRRQHASQLEMSLRMLRSSAASMLNASSSYEVVSRPKQKALRSIPEKHITRFKNENLKKLDKTCKPPSVKMRKKFKLVTAATHPAPRATAFTSSPSNLIDH